MIANLACARYSCGHAEPAIFSSCAADHGHHAGKHLGLISTNNKRLDELSKRLDDLAARLGRIEDRLLGIENRLATLERKVDALEIKAWR